MDGATTTTELRSLVLDQSPDALSLCEADDTIRYWNPAAEALFGFSAAEALGRRWCELVVPEDGHAAALQGRAQQPAGAPVASRAALRRHRDGHMLYVDELSRSFGGGGAPLRFLISSRDVTALTIERDTALLEERYRDLLESLPDAVVVINEIGRVVLVNEQAQTLFGSTRARLIGSSVDALLPERFAAPHAGHRMRYQRQPQVRRMGVGLALFALREGGEEFPVEISLSPLRVGSRHFVVSAIRDITLQKAAERELQEKNEALHAAHQAKDRFLATMSHELRTPLNAILGFTGILLMRLPGALNAEQQRQLSIVKSSGEHLLALINDLLDLAKIQSGTFTLLPEETEIGALLREVRETLQPLAERKGLALTMQRPLQPVVRRVDRRALRQVLVNLTHNAIKFTESGEVGLSLEADDEQLSISVSDTGIGIAAEDLPRLFTSFTQVGDPRRRPEGAGLGLHLCARLAALMGGRVEVQSTPGVGSRFTLRLGRP